MSGIPDRTDGEAEHRDLHGSDQTPRLTPSDHSAFSSDESDLI